MEPCHHTELNMSIGDLILSNAKLYGRRIAMVCSISGTSKTYSQLASLAERLSRGLYGLGVRKGDVICLVCHNCPEYTVFSLATLLIGAVVSTANPALTPGELRSQLLNNDTKFIFCAEVNVGSVNSAVLQTSVQDIIVLGESLGCTSYSSLLNAQNVHASSEHRAHINVQSDAAFLPYSSGTTGHPKGVMHTHHSIIANIHQFSHPMVQTESPHVEQEVYIAALPLFHVFGFLSVQLYGLYKGHRIVYMPKFSLDTYLRVIQEHKATMLHLVPPIVLMILNRPNLASVCDFTLVHVAYSGAATLSQDIEHAFLQTTGIASFKQGYGMSEAGVLAMTPSVNGRAGSVGIPLPGTQAKVIDADGGVLAANQTGEFCFRGPQIMKGYLKNADATNNTIDGEGWLHTGDIGYCDSDGFLYVTGRLKELIKYKGHQVAPAELESLLLSHPAIQDAAIVGYPEPMAGELPVAFVVKKHHAQISSSAIIQFIKDNVAPFKQLRGGVRFVTSIPKSPSGKILRRVLKDKLNQSNM